MRLTNIPLNVLVLVLCKACMERYLKALIRLEQSIELCESCTKAIADEGGADER